MTPQRFTEILTAGCRLAAHPFNARARSLALLALENPPGLFQPEPTTAPDRYPELFRFARAQLHDAPQTRLLSFGCSTGEEVFSLRRYFPLAQIKGLDANRRNIAECLRRLDGLASRAGLAFETASSPVREPECAYDAVFAMAVFRHGGLNGAPLRCDHLIRFADFDACVAALARLLKPGGLLILRHANFRFSDTRVAQGFTRTFAARAPADGKRPPIYGPDDKLAPLATGDDGVFEKRSDAAQSDTDAARR